VQDNMQKPGQHAAPDAVDIDTARPGTRSTTQQRIYSIQPATPAAKPRAQQARLSHPPPPPNMGCPGPRSPPGPGRPPTPPPPTPLGKRSPPKSPPWPGTKGVGPTPGGPANLQQRARVGVGVRAGVDACTWIGRERGRERGRGRGFF